MKIDDEVMGREAEGDEAETRAVKTVCEGRTEIYGCVAHYGAREWCEEKAKAETHTLTGALILRFTTPVIQREKESEFFLKLHNELCPTLQYWVQ